jgi:hypothetical protein
MDAGMPRKKKPSGIVSFLLVYNALSGIGIPASAFRHRHSGIGIPASWSVRYR